MRDITQSLADARDGERREAMDRLVPLVYAELRSLARAQLRNERPDHSLQVTALVHEVYLRLLGGDRPPWNDRGHFFSAAAEAMRRILIEHARQRGRAKRGGGRVQVDLSRVDLAEGYDPDQVLALDEAFQRMDAQTPPRPPKWCGCASTPV